MHTWPGTSQKLCSQWTPQSSSHLLLPSILNLIISTITSITSLQSLSQTFSVSKSVALLAYHAHQVVSRFLELSILTIDSFLHLFSLLFQLLSLLGQQVPYSSYQPHLLLHCIMLRPIALLDGNRLNTDHFVSRFFLSQMEGTKKACSLALKVNELLSLVDQSEAKCLQFLIRLVSFNLRLMGGSIINMNKPSQLFYLKRIHINNQTGITLLNLTFAELFPLNLLLFNSSPLQELESPINSSQHLRFVIFINFLELRFFSDNNWLDSIDKQVPFYLQSFTVFIDEQYAILVIVPSFLKLNNSFNLIFTGFISLFFKKPNFFLTVLLLPNFDPAAQQLSSLKVTPGDNFNLSGS